MAIYGRMGDTVTLLREASLDEVLRDWGVKPTDRHAQAQKDRKEAASRVGYGMMFWGKSEDGDERIYEMAFCRADDGIKEIEAARRKIMGEARYAESCGASK